MGLTSAEIQTSALELQKFLVRIPHVRKIEFPNIRKRFALQKIFPLLGYMHAWCGDAYIYPHAAEDAATVYIAGQEARTQELREEVADLFSK